MRTRRVAAGLALLALLLCAKTGERSRVLAQTEGRTGPNGIVYLLAPQDVIRTWPKIPQILAKAMIEEYGEPSLMEEDALVWLDNGPWRRTIVYRAAQFHADALPDKDYLQQTIRLEVPAGKAEDLKLFAKGIEVTSADGELSACSDSEKSNYLALNLAEEIIRGERSTHDAKRIFDRAERLAAAGKSSPYAEGLLRVPVFNPKP